RRKDELFRRLVLDGAGIGRRFGRLGWRLDAVPLLQDELLDVALAGVGSFRCVGRRRLGPGRLDHELAGLAVARTGGGRGGEGGVKGSRSNGNERGGSEKLLEHW